jgi:K+-sensing histidine kinase KdpD
MKFTIAYTLLFVYVIAAILFWGYSLEKQKDVVYQLEKTILEKSKLKISAQQYNDELKSIEEKRIRRTKQYYGEGSTFLLIILLSAGIVYYAYYRQLKLSQLQQNFMLSITHELKTPIAGIKLNMQTMQKRKLDEETNKELIKSSVLETNRLNDLCNNILIATQLENKRKVMFADEINLTNLVKEEIEEFKTRYPTLIINSLFQVDDFNFKGESTLWKVVISNLIENARKYSPSDEPIEIGISKENNNVKLSIKDKGVGILDAEKLKIFQKFYRIGNENTRNSKGTGLGLYIVKKIVTLYKYDITVKNNSPKGSIFEVLFS